MELKKLGYFINFNEVIFQVTNLDYNKIQSIRTLIGIKGTFETFFGYI